MRLSVHRQSVLAEFHRVIEPSVSGVEFKQVRQGSGIGDVIDRDHFQVRAVRRQAGESPSDAPEAVHSDSRCHLLPPRAVIRSLVPMTPGG